MIVENVNWKWEFSDSYGGDVILRINGCNILSRTKTCYAANSFTKRNKKGYLALPLNSSISSKYVLIAVNI